jgi:hypothetical protein
VVAGHAVLVTSFVHQQLAAATALVLMSPLHEMLTSLKHSSTALATLATVAASVRLEVSAIVISE